MADTTKLSADEQQLADLGYKQELNRSWSGFSNFAISFSIISILAGCFTTFYFGWNNGGPIAISIGWPLDLGVHPHHRLLHVRAGVGLPDLGRHLLVGEPSSAVVKAGYYTGWLNLVGLIVAIVASVAYGCATFLDFSLSPVQRVVGRGLLARAGLLHVPRHPDLHAR